MPARKDWFDVYAAAILESDLHRIQERVATARKAIADRILQLETGEPADGREPRDLRDALDKLQLLLNVASLVGLGACAGSPETPTFLNRAV